MADNEVLQDFRRVPGLFRSWDLQLVFQSHDDYHVAYAELTADGAPLFAVYRRAREKQQ